MFASFVGSLFVCGGSSISEPKSYQKELLIPSGSCRSHLVGPFGSGLGHMSIPDPLTVARVMAYAEYMSSCLEPEIRGPFLSHGADGEGVVAPQTEDGGWCKREGKGTRGRQAQSFTTWGM